MKKFDRHLKARPDTCREALRALRTSICPTFSYKLKQWNELRRRNITQVENVLASYREEHPLKQFTQLKEIS